MSPALPFLFATDPSVMPRQTPRSNKPTPSQLVAGQARENVTWGRAARTTATIVQDRQGATGAPAPPAVAAGHIRVRVHYLHLQRGGGSHDPLEDCLNAERESSSRTAPHD